MSPLHTRNKVSVTVDNVHNVKQCSEKAPSRVRWQIILWSKTNTNFISELSSAFATSEPSQYRLLLSLVTFDTREGLEEKGRRATIQLLTPAPRPCISPSSVKSPPPMEHGLDLRTRCFLAATASLLSSFTRDSDLEGEPPLADTTLVVPKSHVFTLSAWTLGFGSFGLFSFGFLISPQILVSSCPAACCPRPDSTQRSWERILKIYITLLHTKQKASRSKCPWERLNITFWKVIWAICN